MKRFNLDIVIPIYNNVDVLEKSIKKQIEFYSKNLNNFNWNIIIANNASNQYTISISKKLAKKFKQVQYISILKKGRGNALKTAWSLSNSDFLSYMDVDLATDLKAFPELINNLKEGYDISVGSKYIKQAKCKRNLARYIISRLFNWTNIILFNSEFTDAQCGFKAITKEAATKILPKIKDGNWFFDTELLVYSQKRGLKIKEVPITWTELGMAKKSGVKMLKTIKEFIIKMIELKFRGMKI